MEPNSPSNSNWKDYYAARDALNEELKKQSILNEYAHILSLEVNEISCMDNCPISVEKLTEILNTTTSILKMTLSRRRGERSLSRRHYCLRTTMP